MIRALVITHGNIGGELVRVVEMILGSVAGLTALSNAGKSGTDMQADVAAWLAEGDGQNGEIILIDDYGGSCANAAILACGENTERTIVSGVNLAMLLGYVTWRDCDDHSELVAKVIHKGREAIALVGGR
jgi:mannose/fructose-specific phosphotransferase system component IIA